ncbi:hypothetical protein TKK_0000003 [Trichogramma kaykai]
MKSILCLFLVAVSAICFVEINAERPPICRAGSVAYCKDMQSAKVCGKLRFCQMVWKPPAGYKIIKNGNHYEVLNPNIGFFHVG